MPRMPKVVIGLTGGLGSGKSTVLREFKRLGAKTWDADMASRQAVSPGGKAYSQIRAVFGKQFFDKSGKLKRRELAVLIFRNKRLRKKLEKIVHPPVIRELKSWIKGVNDGVGVADVPLLFEAGLEDLFHKILVVWVPAHVQIKRVCRRDHIAGATAREYVRSQWNLGYKKKLADCVIDNSGNKRDTRRQIKILYQRLKKCYKEEV